MIEGFVLKGVVNELDDRCDKLEEKVKVLEEKAHTPRDFVVCENCKQKIKEK